MVNIETTRLILRTINIVDAERVNKLCNDKAITSTTLRIPYPSSLEDTKKFIEVCGKSNVGKNIILVMILKSSNEIIGVMGLQGESVHERAELGYWIGKDYWGKGYCTEAAKAVLEYGFVKLNLHRIYAYYMQGNEASGRVMQKIGMKYEGCLKEHIKKDGIFRDMECYGILRKDLPK